MGLDTAIIMIVGIVALVCLRLVLSLVGRDNKTDHVVVRRHHEADTVYRQAGRNRHLLTAPEPVIAPEPPVV
jgi:hypothetical protein